MDPNRDQRPDRAIATCDTCCCCVELKRGCFIIGYMELIGSIYSMIQLFSLWGIKETVITEVNDLLKNNSKATQEQLIRSVIVGIFIVCVLLLAFKFFFTILLLVGLHKNNRGHVGTYLIYNAIYGFLSAIFIIVGIVQFANINNNPDIRIPPEVASAVSSQIVSIILSYVVIVYFWMVIRSQYHTMPINRPKKPTNPMVAEPSTPAPNVRPGGPMSQLYDEGSWGPSGQLNGNRMEAGSPALALA